MSRPSANTQSRPADISKDTIVYRLDNDETLQPTQQFVRRVLESGITGDIHMNPYRILSRTHRHIPAWVIESGEENDDATITATPLTMT